METVLRYDIVDDQRTILEYDRLIKIKKVYK